jgi:AcrR family transcriptional regulator
MAAETEALIFRTAYTHFLQNGYQGARMQQIAQSAGISKALLFYHFGSKEELYQAVCSQVVVRLDALFACLNNPENGPGYKLEALRQAIQLAQNQEPEFFLFMLAESLKQPDRFCPTVPIRFTAFARQWQQLLDQKLVTQTAEEKVQQTLAESLLPFLQRTLLQGWFSQPGASHPQSPTLNFGQV